MTRTGTYILTAASAALFVFLTIVFDSGLWDPGNLFSGHYYSEYTIWTYLMLALIVGAGIYQAQKIPAEGIKIQIEEPSQATGQTDDPKLWKKLLGNVYFAIFWMPVRFFVGLAWLQAGEHKIRDDAWVGTGEALKSSWTRYAAVPEPPARPAISNDYSWYRDFIQYMLDNEWYTWFGPLIAFGEFLVGIGLIVGALVGIAAFFGTLMNFSFMLAGTASSNPVLFGLGVFLVLAWKVAGYWGLDRYLLPSLGAPWKSGSLFHGEGVRSMEAGTGGTRGKAIA